MEAADNGVADLDLTSDDGFLLFRRGSRFGFFFLFDGSLLFFCFSRLFGLLFDGLFGFLLFRFFLDGFFFLLFDFLGRFLCFFFGLFGRFFFGGDRFFDKRGFLDRFFLCCLDRFFFCFLDRFFFCFLDRFFLAGAFCFFTLFFHFCDGDQQKDVDDEKYCCNCNHDNQSNHFLTSCFCI